MSTSISTVLAHLIGNSWSHYNAYKFKQPFFDALYDPRNITYVRISDPTSSRRDSIGIAVPVDCDPDVRTNWNPPKSKASSNYYYDSHFVADIYLGDKKVIKHYNFAKRGIEWLPDYTGPQTWVFTKKAPGEGAKKHLDCLGDQIKLGDFGVYADTDGTIYYGTVTKISKAGAIYVTNIITPGKYKREFRLRRGDQFSIMHKDIFSKLMLIKLAHP